MLYPPLVSQISRFVLINSCPFSNTTIATEQKVVFVQLILDWNRFLNLKEDITLLTCWPPPVRHQRQGIYLAVVLCHTISPIPWNCKKADWWKNCPDQICSDEPSNNYKFPCTSQFEEFSSRCKISWFKWITAFEQSFTSFSNALMARNEHQWNQFSALHKLSGISCLVLDFVVLTSGHLMVCPLRGRQGVWWVPLDTESSIWSLEQCYSLAFFLACAKVFIPTNLFSFFRITTRRS